MSTKRSRRKQNPVFEDVVIELDDTDEAAILARIQAPIVWGTWPPGFEIRDVAESEFEEVVDFMKEVYLTNDLLYRNVNILDDEESVENYCMDLMALLRDKCAICAVHTESKRIIGVIVTRITHKSNYGKVYSRVKFTRGEAYGKIKKVLHYINRKTDIFTLFNCESYLRCYMLAVHNDFRHRGIGMQLINAAIALCGRLQLSVLMGIFPTADIQEKLQKIGFETIFELYYVDWVDKEKEVIFYDPGAGNYTLSLMARNEQNTE